MALPEDYDNDVEMEDIHPAAHNDVNHLVNLHENALRNRIHEGIPFIGFGHSFMNAVAGMTYENSTLIHPAGGSTTQNGVYMERVARRLLMPLSRRNFPATTSYTTAGLLIDTAGTGNWNWIVGSDSGSIWNDIGHRERFWPTANYLAPATQANTTLFGLNLNRGIVVLDCMWNNVNLIGASPAHIVDWIDSVESMLRFIRCGPTIVYASTAVARGFSPAPLIINSVNVGTQYQSTLDLTVQNTGSFGGAGTWTTTTNDVGNSFFNGSFISHAATPSNEGRSFTWYGNEIIIGGVRKRAGTAGGTGGTIDIYIDKGAPPTGSPDASINCQAAYGAGTSALLNPAYFPVSARISGLAMGTHT